MTRMYVNAKIRAMKAIENRELGQGTLEYLGIVIVAAILVVAVVGAFDKFKLGEEIGKQLDKITGAAA